LSKLNIECRAHHGKQKHMEIGEISMHRFVKCTWSLNLLVTVALLATLALAGPAAAKPPSSAAGATLQASKTIDICDPGDGVNWIYSGEVSVWNEGVTDTQGLKIFDCIQQKNVSGPNFTDQYCAVLTDLGVVVIPGLTPEETAITFPYSFTAAPLDRTIRNRAKVTITNHSGQTPGTPFGPEPKATYTGTVPPPSCALECGCALTLGYWKTHPEAWPTGFDPNAVFFSNTQSWLEVLQTEPQGNGYYILAHQYIAAALNQANDACTPDGLFGTTGTFTLADGFFSGGALPTSCPFASSCGLQKTWAAILDDYNNGLYPGGPEHCGE
jgi:hypothetical protein